MNKVDVPTKKKIIITSIDRIQEHFNDIGDRLINKKISYSNDVFIITGDELIGNIYNNGYHKSYPPSK